MDHVNTSFETDDAGDTCTTHYISLVSHSTQQPLPPCLYNENERTYNKPTAKTAETAILRFLAICKRHTDPMGSARMAKSDATLMDPPTISTALKFTHFPGRKGFHIFSRGVPDGMECQYLLFCLGPRLEWRFYDSSGRCLTVEIVVERELKETSRARKGVRTLKDSNKRYSDIKQDIAPDDEMRKVI